MLDDLFVERMVDPDCLGTRRMSIVIIEIGHGAAVKIVQSLRPTHEGVFDFPEELLGLLSDAKEVRGHLQQQALLFRDDDIHGCPLQVY